MNMPELRHLEYLAAIAKEGTFSAAAEALHTNCSPFRNEIQYLLCSFHDFSAKFPDYSHGIGDFNVIRFHVYIVAAAGFTWLTHTIFHQQFFVHRMIS